MFNHITSANKSQKRDKNKNYFSNFDSKENLYLSENQRNLTKFNSQKKIKRKESYSNNKNNIKKNPLLYALNDNNIQLKNFSNLFTKNSKTRKNTNNKNKNKSHYLSKPQIEIEINNRNNSNNVSSHYSKITNNKKYKKNISEHDLVNNILNTFSNYNYQKGNIILSNKKICSYDKNKIKKNNTTDSKKLNKNKPRHASDTKLLRSSSGYSYINSNLAQTNSFFNGNNINQLNHLGYISTWGNNPEITNNNFANLIKISNQKNNKNKQNNKNNKGPIIGKIIKNYKNNDLNCIFNMNLIQPTSQINNIQDYFKNLYKIEYNSDNRNKKNKNNNNKKESLFNEDKEKEERLRTNNEEYSHSKNTMTKTNDISRNKKEKDNLSNSKFCNDGPEEIHFYVISSIQNAKNMERKMNKK